jgi:hypothetical protein
VGTLESKLAFTVAKSGLIYDENYQRTVIKKLSEFHLVLSQFFIGISILSF